VQETHALSRSRLVNDPMIPHIFFLIYGLPEHSRVAEGRQCPWWWRPGGGARGRLGDGRRFGQPAIWLLLCSGGLLGLGLARGRTGIAAGAL